MNETSILLEREKATLSELDEAKAERDRIKKLIARAKSESEKLVYAERVINRLTAKKRELNDRLTDLRYTCKQSNYSWEHVNGTHTEKRRKATQAELIAFASTNKASCDYMKKAHEESKKRSIPFVGKSVSSDRDLLAAWVDSQLTRCENLLAKEGEESDNFKIACIRYAELSYELRKFDEVYKVITDYAIDNLSLAFDYAYSRTCDYSLAINSLTRELYRTCFIIGQTTCNKLINVGAGGTKDEKGYTKSTTTKQKEESGARKSGTDSIGSYKALTSAKRELSRAQRSIALQNLLTNDLATDINATEKALVSDRFNLDIIHDLACECLAFVATKYEACEDKSDFTVDFRESYEVQKVTKKMVLKYSDINKDRKPRVVTSNFVRELHKVARSYFRKHDSILVDFSSEFAYDEETKQYYKLYDVRSNGVHESIEALKKRDEIFLKCKFTAKQKEVIELREKALNFKFTRKYAEKRFFSEDKKKEEKLEAIFGKDTFKVNLSEYDLAICFGVSRDSIHDRLEAARAKACKYLDFNNYDTTRIYFTTKELERVNYPRDLARRMEEKKAKREAKEKEREESEKKAQAARAKAYNEARAKVA